ncbi:MAG: hypothetical protein M0036_09800 [Desulfobacteraceae bacterium]|nr:hypothetical protein [Desulfobacteraceae bacterium]
MRGGSHRKIGFLTFSISLLLFPAACANLPGLRPAEPSSAESRTAQCVSIFPAGRWQFTHAIEFFPPDGSKQTLMGVLQISSQQRTFHCVMLTIEGMVLFEADYDGTGAVTIQRAITPMDKPGMAEGMIQDILLIFFAPVQPYTAAGFTESGAWICRYPSIDHGTEDILLRPEGTWQINHYDARHNLLRTVNPMAGDHLKPNTPPSRIELIAHGLAGYRLRMSLVEAASLK